MHSSASIVPGQIGQEAFCIKLLYTLLFVLRKPTQYGVTLLSDLQQKLDKYKNDAIAQLEAAGETSIDDAMLSELVNNLKLVIENKDAIHVAGTDPSEMETVRKNFIVKKLGVDDQAKGKSVCDDVAAKMSGSRMKNRAAFYYLCKKALS